MDNQTHAKLVRAAATYLRNHVGPFLPHGCPIVITEDRRHFEQPDAIGWKDGISYLIECKTTLGDFLSDKKKPFRLKANEGMGDFRYFLTLPGLLEPDDLPDDWGLLERHSRDILEIKKALQQPCNKAAEVRLLAGRCRLIRRRRLSHHGKVG